MKIVKLVAILWVSMHLVSCFEKPRYEKPIKSLQLYISFEEPKVIVYGHERELITFKKILENAWSFGMSYYPGNTKNGWITGFSFYSDELVMPSSNDFKEEDRLNLGKITGTKDGASSLMLSWQEDIQIQRDGYLVDGVYTLFYDTIFSFTPSYFDTSSCSVEEPYSGYGPRPCTLTLDFMQVESNIIRAAPMILNGMRPMSYGLTFKEVERDEQGILFELFLINNREIEP